MVAGQSTLNDALIIEHVIKHALPSGSVHLVVVLGGVKYIQSLLY